MSKIKMHSRGIRAAYFTAFLFPNILADAYGTCIEHTYSKKFICELDSTSMLHVNSTKNWSIPECPKQNFLFIGDSMMIELANVLQCTCPNSEVRILGAKGTKKPLSKILHEQGKMFNKDSVVVLNFGLWFNVNNLKLYTKEVHRVRSELQVLLKLPDFPPVVFVTTTAQHFCTEGGVYRKKGLGTKCCAVSNPNTSRQQYAMKHLIKPLKMRYFDGFEITKKWFFAHPGHGDCTHLCSNENGPLVQFGVNFLSFIQNLQL